MRLINFDDLRAQKGITYSRIHLRRLVKAGAFPKPIPLSRSRIAWKESEIDAWIEERAAARQAPIGV